MQAIGRQRQRAPDGATLQYERHRSEQTTLYCLVQQHAASVTPHTEASTGSKLPRFVRHQSDAFLECGLSVRRLPGLRCGECGHDKLQSTSCKRGGRCKSRASSAPTDGPTNSVRISCDGSAPSAPAQGPTAPGALSLTSGRP